MKNGQACYREATEGLAPSLRQRLLGISDLEMENARELRLISSCNPVVLTGEKRLVIKGEVTAQELSQSLMGLCGDSIHTHQRELACGFLPLKGGHRAGVAATAVYGANGELQSLRGITAIVVRIAHDVTGVADKLLPQLFPHGLCGALIAGPPGSGKTTLLRDLARKLSQGELSGCHSVALVDERGELSRSGEDCCVLKGYDKADGIISAVRSLSPQVIFCDEIGSKSDAQAVIWALNCGVSVITSIHARDRRELLNREAGRELIASGAFERIVFLAALPTPGTIMEVITANELNKAWGDTFPISLLRRGGNGNGEPLRYTSG